MVIVTGLDSGTGQAIAEEFARHGADVAITWFEDETGAKKTSEAVETTGRKSIGTQLDVRDPPAIALFIGEVETRVGTPTVLVNDASVDVAAKEVTEISITVWKDRFQTNVHDPFTLAAN